MKLALALLMALVCMTLAHPWSSDDYDTPEPHGTDGTTDMDGDYSSEEDTTTPDGDSGDDEDFSKETLFTDLPDDSDERSSPSRQSTSYSPYDSEENSNESNDHKY